MVNETITLNIVVDSNLAGALARSARQVENFGKRSTVALNQLTAAQERAASRTKALRDLFLRLGGAFLIFRSIRTVTDDLIDFESGLIGVGKTSGITGQPLEQFGDRIADLSIKLKAVPTGDLLQIAEFAGQLGVRGSENLQRFTETVGKLTRTSDLSAEFASKGLARILNVTGEAVENVNRLGSAITDLGNNFAATESEILEAGTRVAVSTAQFSTSAEQALAIGAALKSVGIQAELGGTAVGRTVRAIDAAVRENGANLELLGEITKQTGEQFAESFGQDQIKGFLDFLDGINDISQAGGNAVTFLEEFGLRGQRTLAVLPSLATRIDIAREALDRSSQAYKVNNATTFEFAQRQKSLESQIQLVRNSVVVFSRSLGRSGLGAALRSGTRFLSDFFLTLAGQENLIQGNVLQMKAFTAATVGATAALAAFAAGRTLTFLIDVTKALKSATVAMVGFFTATNAAGKGAGAVAVGLAKIHPALLLTVAGIGAVVSAATFFKDSLVDIEVATNRVSLTTQASWEDAARDVERSINRIDDTFQASGKQTVAVQVSVNSFLKASWQELVSFFQGGLGVITDGIKLVGVAIAEGFRLTGAAERIAAFVDDAVAGFEVLSELARLGLGVDLGALFDPLAEAVERIKASAAEIEAERTRIDKEFDRLQQRFDEGISGDPFGDVEAPAQRAILNLSAVREVLENLQRQFNGESFTVDLDTEGGFRQPIDRDELIRYIEDVRAAEDAWVNVGQGAIAALLDIEQHLGNTTLSAIESVTAGALGFRDALSEGLEVIIKDFGNAQEAIDAFRESLGNSLAKALADFIADKATAFTIDLVLGSLPSKFADIFGAKDRDPRVVADENLTKALDSLRFAISENTSTVAAFERFSQFQERQAAPFGRTDQRLLGFDNGLGTGRERFGASFPNPSADVQEARARLDFVEPLSQLSVQQAIQRALGQSYGASAIRTIDAEAVAQQRALARQFGNLERLLQEGAPTPIPARPSERSLPFPDPPADFWLTAQEDLRRTLVNDLAPPIVELRQQFLDLDVAARSGIGGLREIGRTLTPLEVSTGPEGPAGRQADRIRTQAAGADFELRNRAVSDFEEELRASIISLGRLNSLSPELGTSFEDMGAAARGAVNALQGLARFQAEVTPFEGVTGRAGQSGPGLPDVEAARSSRVSVQLQAEQTAALFDSFRDLSISARDAGQTLRDLAELKTPFEQSTAPSLSGVRIPDISGALESLEFTLLKNIRVFESTNELLRDLFRLQDLDGGNLPGQTAPRVPAPTPLREQGVFFEPERFREPGRFGPQDLGQALDPFVVELANLAAQLEGIKLPPPGPAAGAQSLPAFEALSSEIAGAADRIANSVTRAAGGVVETPLPPAERGPLVRQLDFATPRTQAEAGFRLAQENLEFSRAIARNTRESAAAARALQDSTSVAGSVVPGAPEPATPTDTRAVVEQLQSLNARIEDALRGPRAEAGQPPPAAPAAALPDIVVPPVDFEPVVAPLLRVEDAIRGLNLLVPEQRPQPAVRPDPASPGRFRPPDPPESLEVPSFSRLDDSIERLRLTLDRFILEPPVAQEPPAAAPGPIAPPSPAQAIVPRVELPDISVPLDEALSAASAALRGTFSELGIAVELAATALRRVQEPPEVRTPPPAVAPTAPATAEVLIPEISLDEALFAASAALKREFADLGLAVGTAADTLSRLPQPVAPERLGGPGDATPVIPRIDTASLDRASDALRDTSNLAFVEFRESIFLFAQAIREFQALTAPSPGIPTPQLPGAPATVAIGGPFAPTAGAPPLSPPLGGGADQEEESAGLLSESADQLQQSAQAGITAAGQTVFAAQFTQQSALAQQAITGVTAILLRSAAQAGATSQVGAAAATTTAAQASSASLSFAAKNLLIAAFALKAAATADTVTGLVAPNARGSLSVRTPQATIEDVSVRSYARGGIDDPVRGQVGAPTRVARRAIQAASGGIFKRRTFLEVAEAGQAEAVVPLPDNREIPVDLRILGGGGGREESRPDLTPGMAVLGRAIGAAAATIAAASMLMTDAAARSAQDISSLLLENRQSAVQSATRQGSLAQQTTVSGAGQVVNVTLNFTSEGSSEGGAPDFEAQLRSQAPQITRIITDAVRNRRDANLTQALREVRR